MEVSVYITGARDSSFRGLGFGFLKWLLLEKMEGFPFEVARSLRGDTGRGAGKGPCGHKRVYVYNIAKPKKEYEIETASRDTRAAKPSRIILRRPQNLPELKTQDIIIL